jgi:hypothetical protein
MAPNTNGFEFSIFDFIWEEIKASRLWICSLSHAYDRESDSSHIPLWEEAPLLADQEWLESSSGEYKSSGTTFFTSYGC